MQWMKGVSDVDRRKQQNILGDLGKGGGTGNYIRPLIIKADLSAMSEIAAKRHFKIEARLFGLLHEPGGMRSLPVISISLSVS